MRSNYTIPPLAYFDGRELRPVHVAYVGTWEEAYWVEGNRLARIPAWDLKEAVAFIPREALGARAPQGYRGGVLRVVASGTATELVEAPPGVAATYSYLEPGQEAGATAAIATWAKPPTAVDKPATPTGSPLDPVYPDGAFIFNQTRGLDERGL